MMILPLMATFPCEIHDWITFRLCSGYCSRQASSSRLFFACASKQRACLVPQRLPVEAAHISCQTYLILHALHHQRRPQSSKHS